MFVFDEKSTLRTLTPWGVEVKKRLIDNNLRQQDLVIALQKKGYKVNKIIISQILYGIGASVRTEEIMEINRILKIPFVAYSSGIYGLNAGLLRDCDTGELFAITARNSALFLAIQAAETPRRAEVVNRA